MSSQVAGTALAVVEVMLTLEDFTTLSWGSEVPLEGRVDRCPKCGRNGIEQSEPERLLFVHVQETELRSDGMLTEPRDCCRVPIV